jgi:hypothetical protein
VVFGTPELLKLLPVAAEALALPAGVVGPSPVITIRVICDSNNLNMKGKRREDKSQISSH